MEEQLNYTLMPSLEHFALIKTAITLWNLDDICHLTAKFYFTPEEWSIAENRVMKKVKGLPLPESLKKKVLGFIRPIGIEMRKWMNDYVMISSYEYTRFIELCWTPQGTVDRRKTAERLIREVDLSITTRYKLACINCLKNDILILWNKMPEDCKKSFYSEENPRRVNQDALVVLWTYDIKGELTRMYDISNEKWTGCTPYQYAFHYAVSRGNKAATEYFLQNLTSEEREVSLERSVSVRYLDSNQDMLCYLLSQMNEVQQVRMFRRYSYYLLICLLDWPSQGFFMETANHMWDYLAERNYYFLLKNIIEKIKDGFKDYNYQKLFREFWEKSPFAHKKFVIDQCNNKQSLLQDLLQIKDKEHVKLILKDATITDREKVIFSAEGKYICENLIYEDEMDLLEFFIQECISSKDQILKFKEEFQRYIIFHHSQKALEDEKYIWNKVFQLLNDLTQKFDKRRCVEEGNSDPVKRLCSLTSE